MKFIKPEPNIIPSTQNFEGLKLLTTMSLKLRHNFQDCLNPICSCGQEMETASHFLLHYLNCRCARKTFFEKINLVDSNILQQSDISITKDLLFGSEKLNDDKNNASLTPPLSSFSRRRDSNTSCFNHKQPVRLAFILSLSMEISYQRSK